FQAEDGIRDLIVTGVQTCALPILPEQTRWDPQLETPQIADALDEASVLVLPSRSEGLPRVVIEALCRGRPVLATPVGGVPDLIRSEERRVGKECRSGGAPCGGKEK